MKIKRIELVGFKSFVDPTVIEFEAPIIAIVGPNGSGKTNIVDAVRWVMGEMSAKSLRGKGMEDVIFNGSESRPGVGLAEVSLTFSTEDGIVPAEFAAFPEVTISRRLYRSGESEYLINRIPCRLKDIIELFLGTGVGHRAYSVIEQGRIETAINARPEERRLLIEEAAGVSKFKARKDAALRKIDAAEQNLARLKDILREVSRQIQSLDRQVKKAERFRALKKELREMELRLAATATLEQGREVEELKNLLQDWTAREARAQAQMASLELDHEEKRLRLVEQERSLSDLQERFFETSSRLQLAQAKEQFQTREGEALQEQILSAEAEIQRRKEEILQVEKEQASLEEKLRKLSRRDGALSLLEEREREWQELTQMRDDAVRTLEGVRQDLGELEKTQERVESDRRVTDERAKALEEKITKLGGEIGTSNRQESFTRESLEENGKALQTGFETLGQLQAKEDNLRETLAADQERKAFLESELHLRQEELVQRRSRIRSLIELEKNFEGYDEGVRTLLSGRKRGASELSGMYGVVADFVETPAEYEAAVSAALGEKLQYVIVKSHEAGLSALGYLKAQATGRGAFIPLELRESEPEPFPEIVGGVLGPLLSKVRLKEEYHQLGQYLLGDFVLVRSIDDALTLWRANGHKKSLVTLDGEVIDPFGVVSGGTTGIRGKLLLEKKRELKDLRVEVAELEDRTGLEEDSVSQMEGQISAHLLEQGEIREAILNEEVRQTARQKELDHHEDLLRQIREDRRKLEAEREELEASSEALTHERNEIEQKRQNLGRRREQASDSLVRSEELVVLLNERERDLSGQVTQIKIESGSHLERKSNLEREIERSQEKKTELAQQIDRKSLEIEECHLKRGEIDSNILATAEEKKELAQKVATLGQEQEAAKSVQTATAQECRKLEEGMRGARKESDLSKSHLGDLRVTLSRLEGEVAFLTAQISEKYSIVLSAIAPQYQEVTVDRPAEEEALAKLKDQIEKMGDVNLGAIPEYEELIGRQRFLQTQTQDLESSLEAIRKAITKINQTTRKRFEETFTLVNERFQSLVPRLFRGGRAQLKLVTEGDFQSGVELFVQPPGKKLSHVGLLSGGEKAMAALAFVFSIFLVKPSPFCILDEVDAPLDDNNVDRFHHLLTEMVPRSQFILITHNRRTMERADLLYGITMEEPGISKVVSVRLAEALPLAS